MARPWQLGLTGGIGSGKSTFAAMLVNHGALLIDADALARAATSANGAAMSAVQTTFGDGVLAPDGSLDRERMRALAFAEPLARQRLEAIVHPLVRAAATRQLQDAEAAGKHWVVQDIPLLAESTRPLRQFDAVLVVDCSESTQVQRVVARNGLPAATVRAIIAAQAPRPRRLAIADMVVFNDEISLPTLAAHAAHVALAVQAALARNTRGL